MSLKDTLLDGLAKLSPVIGTALGGPVGGLIGKGIAVAASTITGKTQPDDILAELSASPDKLLELEARTADRELEELRIHAADRDSARKREVAIGGYSNQILAATLVAGFFLVIYSIFNDKSLLSGESAVLVGAIFGQLSIMINQVVAYHFGSSKGSDKKTDLLARNGK